MTRFNAKKEKKNIMVFLPVFLLAVALLVFVLSTNSISTTNTNQEYEILDKALTRSITQCYALEGTYPPSLKYLEENYGLIYNKDHFFVDYQYIGSNLRPDVTIIGRE